MATSFKSDYAIPKSAAPVPLRQSTADLYLHRRHSNTVLSQSLWDSWVLVHTRFIWALWASLTEMGFDSKREFAPPSILQGLLLCPWAWGISSQPFQHHAATTQAPTVLLVFFWPWTWSISSWPLQPSTAATPDLDVGKAHSGKPPPKFLVELLYYYLSDFGLDGSLLRTFWQHY